MEYNFECEICMVRFAFCRVRNCKAGRWLDKLNKVSGMTPAKQSTTNEQNYPYSDFALNSDVNWLYADSSSRKHDC